MAAEREQKLRGQHCHYNHATQKATDHITAIEKHSLNFPKKWSTSSQCLPKNSIPVVEEEQYVN